MEAGTAPEAREPPTPVAAAVRTKKRRGAVARRGERAPLKTSEKIWVASTLSLILFLVVSPQPFLFAPYFFHRLAYETRAEAAWHLAKYLVPFNVCAGLLLLNYALCVRMDPGSVPAGWQPPALEEDEKKEAAEGVKERPAKSGNKRRYCGKCKAYKPPRAHHCKTCRRCVLRMDHHCPWVANCVGQRNYASFIRFLFLVDVCCAMHLAGLSLLVLDHWWVRLGGQWRPPSSNGAMVLLVLNYAACVPTLCLVGVFSIYHFYCLATNSTTIEGWEKDKVGGLLRRGRLRADTRGADFPFDLGSALSNAASVLGWSPLGWCWPGATRGDGLVWRVGSHAEWDDQYRWPPADPSAAAAAASRKAAAVTPEMLKSRSPFTYGGDGFNPALTPSNSETLRQRKAAHTIDATAETTTATTMTTTKQSTTPYETGVSSVSPWHPDFHREIESGESESESESEDGQQGSRVRVRRGSEGYEVKPRQWAIDETLDDPDAGGSEEERAASEEEDGNDNDDEYGEERDEWTRGYEEMDREQAWLARQEEEERLRQLLEREMRARGATYIQYDPMMDHDDGLAVVDGGQPLLPSQVMQRRARWQEKQGGPPSPSSSSPPA
ncbi:zf-DHHC-domain-containing protein [Acaromyces ingoldii]|uniref:Palmitoyltransferase n=1 Tax=Acaromyces ingoldii TaxID=215250 RepID=A0A316YNQ0_9BASI|nr:zf-DHHC-domain-containing protein [Acaromyces ingoldii]PWN91007.1 zf-DHHC-domain-containing protein [Acaromyces ingoldii]